MPGCRPSCVEIKTGWTDRQKWNYVKNLYQPNYAIDENGDESDFREVDDPARVNDFTTWDGQYTTDHDTWLTYYSNKPFEKWLQWQYERGTIAYGNLPQHKRNDHTGHCWMPCPYSTDSSADRSQAMWDVYGHPVLPQVDHGDAYMQTDSNGTVWGWRCTYSGCSYETTYNKPYFYV
jgi:hypothetical protein